MDTPYILFAMNALLTIAAFFGGMVIKDLSTAVKELRAADEKLSDEMHESNAQITRSLSGYALKDDFKEFRQEQREQFSKLFDMIGEIQRDLTYKADRPDARR